MIDPIDLMLYGDRDSIKEAVSMVYDAHPLVENGSDRPEETSPVSQPLERNHAGS